jgi:hypothetical protein
VEAARRCLEIDPEHAGANYIAGRLLYEQGEVEPAREYLLAARDHDVCPLRATTPIIQSIIQVAEQAKVPLIRTPHLLDQRDWRGQRRPDGIADPVHFVDHIHPTIRGHQLIAAAIADALAEIEKAEIDTVGAQNEMTAEERYQSLAEAHLAGLGEAYYARGQQRLEGLRRWASGRAGSPAADEMTNAP